MFAYLTVLFGKLRLGIAALPLLVVLLSLNGCASFFSQNFAKPGVELADIEVVHARLLEQQFNLYFRIDNPNDFSLPITGMDYEVELNGISLGKGHSSRLAKIPANGHAYITIPVHTNLWRHIRSVVSMLEKPDQKIHYSLQADIKSGLFFGKKVRVNRNGSLIPGDFLKD